MEPIEHPPGHEIERLNKELEEQHSKDEAEPWAPLDWEPSRQENGESESKTES